MANGADVTITVDANQAAKTIYNVKRQWKITRAEMETPVSINLMQGSKFDKQTNYTKTMDPNSFWGKANNFGKDVRSLHIYGINPLTRGFAKLGSTILGSFIHPITLATTALMALGIGLKKAYDMLVEGNDKAIQRNKAIIESTNNKIATIEKQKKAYDELIEKIQKLQKQNEKLSVGQKDLIDTYIQILKNQGIAEDEIERNPRTGKIQNIGHLTTLMAERTDQLLLSNYKDKVTAINKQLDATLSKALPFYKNTNMFSTGSFKTAPTLDELFPWLQNSSSYEQLDITKLLSMDPQKQYEFFDEVIKISKDIKDVTQEYSPLLQLLLEKTNLLKGIKDLESPLKKVEAQMKDVTGGIKEMAKQGAEVDKKSADIEEDKVNQQRKIAYDQLTPEERIDFLKKENQDLNESIDSLQNKMEENKATLDKWGIVKDDSGELTTKSLQFMLQNNKDLKQLDQQIRDLQKERTERYQEDLRDLLPLVNDEDMQQRYRELQQIYARHDYTTEQDEEWFKFYEGILKNFEDAKKNVDAIYEKPIAIRQQKIKAISEQTAESYDMQLQMINKGKEILSQNSSLLDEIGKKSSKVLSNNLQLLNQQKALDEQRKREGKFWQNLINPLIKNAVKNSNANAAVRYQELLKQFEEQKGSKATAQDIERLKNAAQLEDVNRQIQDILSKEQYTIKNDEFARKGGGYDFYVAQLNPMKNVENLEKQQVELLKQLVNSSNNNAQIFAQGIIFR